MEGGNTGRAEGVVAMAQLFRRRKRGWWHTLAGWALGVVIVYPGGLLAIPVSQHAGAWVVPAAITGLAIALAATVGFFVVKRHSWLLAAPLALGLGFSFCLSLIEGWEAQVKTAIAVAQVLIVIASIGLMVAFFVFLGRAQRRVNRASRDIARELGEQIANEALFRDDGERITVYARRGRVLLQVLARVAILALFAACGLWAHADVPELLWQIVIFACVGFLLFFGGISTLLMLIRALMTGPTLVVNADGIVDNCSLTITGRGLLRWDETLGVEEIAISTNKLITYHFLDLDVVDRRAINRRQPLWKRMLARVTSSRQSIGYRIQRALLDRPPAALAAEINRYIHTHAPHGNWHQAVTEAEVERPGKEQSGRNDAR